MKWLLIFCCVWLHKTAQSTSQVMDYEASSSTRRVIGGQVLRKIKRYSFVASLVEKTDYERKYNLFCGASIIAQQWVLTAAHCFKKDRVGVQVRFNSTKWCDVEGYDIDQVYKHPRYNVKTRAYDAALVHVEDEFPKRFIIKFHSHTRRSKPSTSATLLGWGKTKANNDEVSKALSHVKLKVPTWKKCNSYFKRYWPDSITFTKTMICAGAKGKSPCNGDDGGPLIQFRKRKPVLIGIVSQIANSCKAMYSVYTDVSKISRWIKRTTSNEKARSRAKYYYFY